MRREEETCYYETRTETQKSRLHMTLCSFVTRELRGWKERERERLKMDPFNWKWKENKEQLSAGYRSHPVVHLYLDYVYPVSKHVYLQHRHLWSGGWMRWHTGLTWREELGLWWCWILRYREKRKARKQTVSNLWSKIIRAEMFSFKLSVKLSKDVSDSFERPEGKFCSPGSSADRVRCHIVRTMSPA